MMLLMKSALICDPGCFRKNNQDNYLFAGDYMPAVNAGVDGVAGFVGCDNDAFCAAVFDGMGGFSNGEIAAAIAAEEFGREGMTAFLPDKADAWFTQLNDTICQNAQEMCVNDMGTTVAAVLLQRGLLRLVNIGDSRVYLLRRNKLRCVSHDHTNVKMLESLGLHDRKPSLTQYLGLDPEICLSPFYATLRLHSGDFVLLCTDGLYEGLADSDILSIMNSTSELDLVMRRLLSAARENGARDNITAIVIRVEKERRTYRR